MSNMISQWSPPSRVVFGRGACAQLPDLPKTMDAQKPRALTDPGVAKTKVTADFVQLLRDNGIGFELFAEVVPAPPLRPLP